MGTKAPAGLLPISRLAETASNEKGLGAKRCFLNHMRQTCSRGFIHSSPFTHPMKLTWRSPCIFFFESETCVDKRDFWLKKHLLGKTLFCDFLENESATSPQNNPNFSFVAYAGCPCVFFSQPTPPNTTPSSVASSPKGIACFASSLACLPARQTCG